MDSSSIIIGKGTVCNSGGLKQLFTLPTIVIIYGQPQEVKDKNFKFRELSETPQKCLNIHLTFIRMATLKKRKKKKRRK